MIEVLKERSSYAILDSLEGESEKVTLDSDTDSRKNEKAIMFAIGVDQSQSIGKYRPIHKNGKNEASITAIIERNQKNFVCSSMDVMKMAILGE